MRAWSGRHPATLCVALTLTFVVLNTWKNAWFGLHLADPDGTYPAGVVRAIYLGTFAGTAFLFLLVLRFRHWVALAAVVALQTTYVLINTLYFDYYSSFLRAGQVIGLWREALRLLGFGGVPTSAESLAMALVDVPLAVLLVVRYRTLTAPWRRTPLRHSIYLAAILGLVWFHRFDFNGWIESLARRADDQYVGEQEIVKKHGLLALNLLDISRLGATRDLARRLHTGVPVGGLTDTTTSRPDIVVIQMESIDAAAVGAKYRGEFVMPRLHAMSKTCRYYPFALTYHLAGSTSDCEFSVLNSSPALEDYPSVKVPMATYPNALVKPLTNAGYRVDMFHGNYGDYFGRNGVFHRMGFSHFYDMPAMGLNHVGWGAPDHQVLSFLHSRLDSATTPYCAYFITMSSHEPFIFVDNYYSNPRFRSVRDERTRHYFTSLAYVDSLVADHVTRLRSRRPNTYVFVFGDHSPRVASRDFREASLRHEGATFEFVPIYVLGPGVRPRTERARAASLLDIAPTLLRAAGVEFAITTWGQDLLSDTLTNQVPFRGDIHSREELFALAKRHLER